MGCSASKSKESVVETNNSTANGQQKEKLPTPYPPTPEEEKAQAANSTVVKEDAIEGAGKISKACFGAGCYWGTEKFFFHVFGKNTDHGGAILNGKVGFMGPKDAPANPTYKEVCSGYTGHVEVYDCEYTGGAAYYEKMVRFFFQMHDPTTAGRQGGDTGTQYSSVIYCYEPEQTEIAKKVIAELQALLDKGELSYAYQEKTVTTEVKESTIFYPAHDEHQDYLSVYINGYCNHRVRFQAWPALEDSSSSAVSVEAVQPEVPAQ